MRTEKTQFKNPSGVLQTREGGFTLLEILIAVSILTIGLLGVAKMQVSGIQGNSFSNKTSVALTLAEQKMEDLLGKTYSDAALTGGSHDEGNVNEAGQAGGLFHRTWNVVDNSPINGMTKTVTVTVGWANDAHTVSVTCIKSL